VSGIQVKHVGTVSVLPPPGTASLELAAPFPNPATASTSLRWSMPRAGSAGLRIVDTAGRQVRQLHAGTAPAGEHVSPWDLTNDAGARVAPGMYFAVLETEGRSRSTRVVVMR
jgi:flagellar hook assembly protein FlgD